MALFNTIDFLPSVFQSTTNQRFLGATMDQLASDAINVDVNGYIGRTFAPTYKAGDNYVPELNAERTNYQLEASVVVTDNDKNVQFNAGYIDLLNSINVNNGLTNNHQRLFSAEKYNYDGHFDYDKFVNYYNYYWLPNGPAPVGVSANDTPYQADYTVTRNSAIGGYVFSGLGAHPNLPLTLARGGTYTFTLNQPGFPFWIQTESGTSGTDMNVPTLSTREIFGVKNNGTDVGTITFNVPQVSAQNFYTQLPIVASVDAAVDNFSYTDIQNQLLSTFLKNYPAGLDGVNNQLQNKTFIFINNDIVDADWTTPTVAAPYTSLDTASIRPGSVIPSYQRSSVWQINLVATGTGDYIIQLKPLPTGISSGNFVSGGKYIIVATGTTDFTTVGASSNTVGLSFNANGPGPSGTTGLATGLQKIFVTSGKTYASNQFWLNSNLQYNSVPTITAVDDYLFYQDATNPDFVGVIKIVDNLTSTIDVNTDIIGKNGYTSPNGVIFTNGLKIQFDSSVTPGTYADNQYYVEGVGTSIALVPVDQLVVPELFGEDIDTVADYITINRASQDLNPWTRSNRWFHKDAILASATYNNTTADYGPNIAGRRPIIEFEPNLQLFNYGREAGNNVTYITFDSTDAFADIEGQTSYSLDGYTLKTGDRVIFANDYDVNIINQIYQVQIQNINSTSYITLVPTDDDPVVSGQNFLITSGVNAGKTYYYNGSWTTNGTQNLCQAKSTANQPPLFDLVDVNGYSFGDTTVYPGTNFTGTKFFGYSIGTGSNDTLLGFPLTYQNFNNIGDIVFTNFYDTDTFTDTANPTAPGISCNTGYLAKNKGLGNVTKLNNWTSSVEPTEQYQVFTKFYEGITLTINNVATAFVQIDVLPVPQATVPHLKVYLNNQLLTPTTDYQLTMYGVYNLITFTQLPNLGDKIDIAIFSNTTSQLGAYYEIPENLNSNALNENFDTITLGQVRTHYNKLIENTSVSTTGIIPLQDNYLKNQGGTLIQHQAPAIYAMTFLNDPTVNFISGLNLARKEYQKFKNKFLSLCSSLTTIDYTNPITGVDTILQSINSLKNSTFPWYYSDMVPQGSSYSEITYSVLNARQTQYEINTIFNNTLLGNRAVLVYVNGVQKTLGVDYNFSTVSPAIIFTNTFTVGDTIVIRDYASTDGNYIPETPTKLGLYPKSAPEIYLDNTYQTPVTVIRGHDGSITPAFGDFRDNYLLELELRIYNNIKADYARTQIDLADIIPGRFKTIDYSLTEYNQVLAQNFLAWAGANNVDYTDNLTYDANNPWTWNYNTFSDIVDGSLLQGFWRAIYDYWFDTDTPNLTPWEMLGFSSQPTWWQEHYGPAPYTSGNALLWEDLEAGYIWNGSDSAAYTDNNFARPGLTSFIPVDSAGNLLDPTKIGIIKQQNPAGASNNFTFGNQGPAETAWRRSSDYPYAIQSLMALTKPALYFATTIDTSRFYTNTVTGQFTNSLNQKISPKLLTVNGATVNGSVQRTSGYLNWIADYIKNLGIDPSTIILNYFTNLNVQLNYKVSGFTDKTMLTVSAEQTSPSSTSGSVIIPDTNYQIYLNKSVPVATAVYSAVIVEKTNSGYSVSGYDPTNPFFTIIPSLANNNSTTLTINGTTVKLYNDSSDTTQMVPYGTEYTSVSQLADFLISYQRALESQGFTFTQFSTDLGVQQDWHLSVQEMIYWSQQGWATGTIIVLNPTASQLRLDTLKMVVDEITNTSNGNKLLNENFVPIKSNNFNILRTDNPLSTNTCTVHTLDGSTIAYAKLNLIQYEHVLIFDNIDDFGDIIYIPEQGTRQFRLKLSGSKTGGWDGALSAPGYIYSNPVIQTWSQGVDYRLGDIVVYNNFYYTASRDIPASTSFNNVLWTRINYSDIQTGLLPSFGLNAQEFVNFYDVDNPPANDVFQEYSAGLIGFRQRSYLTDLGISLPTQTKFYQGFIKQKGTQNAITSLTKANFNNVQGNLNVYEEWAFQVGIYGGVNSNQFKEFVLDQSVFSSNPISFTSSNVYSTANAIVNLNGNAAAGLTGNVYNASNVLNTTTTIYSNRVDNVYMTDLPSVGYVNLNDVDYTQYNITNPNLDITNIGGGNKVWVAKDATGQWDILRVNETNLTATTLTYTLDNYATLLFNARHSFVAGDILILKYFNSLYDGIYEVISTPTPTSVSIAISTVVPAGLNSISPLQSLIRVLSLTGTGTVYKLVSARYSTVDSIAEAAIPPNGWIDYDRVWVDNAIEEGWGVYTYVHPWLSNSAVKVTANTSTSNAYFGHVTKVSTDTNTVYVGSPGTNKVQLFSNVNGVYSASTTLSNADSSFGTSIETQGNLLVIGAPIASNVHVYSGTTPVQLITSANSLGLFGSSISMSGYQHWLYIGEPETGVVSAYWTANVTANISYTKVASFGTHTGNFGQVVKTNDNGTVLFVSAPTANTTVSQAGNVYVYTRSGNTFTLSQTLSSQFTNQSSGFGTGLDIDYTGGNVFIGVPNSTETGYANGVVERYVLNSYGNAYVFNETIVHPRDEAGTFGTSVSVSSDSNLLAVGSVGSPSEESTTFDNNGLIIDSNTTKFIDYILNSGTTYLFEPLVNQSVAGDLGEYVYTQDLETQLYAGEEFGASVDATRGVIAVGAPGAYNNQGVAYIFANPTKSTAWNLTRSQQPIVDIDSVSRTLMYDSTTNNILAALDFIDPAKGKILNAFARDIDYQLTTDPALYNAGTGNTIADLHWGPQQVGTIWWNLDTVRYINYEQDELIYRLTQWGTSFPGSSIDVYQWIASSVPPSQYVANGGLGTPLKEDDSAYSTYGYINPANGVLNVQYYFWVKGLPLVAPGKNNSVYSIAEGIENPQSQGITYAAVLRNDTVALYNVSNLLVGRNTVVQLGSNTSLNTDVNLIHNEYQLVQEGNPTSPLPTNILNKMIDSLSGIDQIGNPVPDPTLPPGQAYGISIRPRQSIVINSDLAISNLVTLVNSLLIAYPVVERKVLTTLNSSEAIPNPESGYYSISVNAITDLDYIDTNLISPGYQVLVASDSSNKGKWAIYKWTGNTTGWIVATRPNGKLWIQSYKTNLYWSYADWYDPSFDPTTSINVTVANQLEFGKLTLVANTYVKVLDNGSGNFVIYYINSDLTTSIVGIENGTVQLPTDSENTPATEFRQILIALTTEIFIDDLAGELNQVFFTMIKYILTEQRNLDWVFKTSFISATQEIRKLEEFPSYIPDNQDFYLEYIQEVKPYRTEIREFVVDYIGNDTYGSDITDFDLPPYWDANLQVYRSPNGDQYYDATLLSNGNSVYSQWYNNYTYSVVDTFIDNPGTGYFIPPQIVIAPPLFANGKPNLSSVATAYAEIANGGITNIIITNAGQGYTTTPSITINGTGTGATAGAILENVFTGNNTGYNLVRSITTTIKFDRTTYTNPTTFVFWSNITSANIGETINANAVIVLNNNLYQLSNAYIIDANITFPVANVTQISAGSLTNAADRIIAFNGNINLDIIPGVEYPGVIVDANSYTSNTFDSTISSNYTDSLGINPSDINIDGGSYFDLYNSHAPEELVPGRMFDNFNMRVFDKNKLSFRTFEDMSGAYTYYRIAESSITTLSANLHLTDSNINVVNASVLPTPQPSLNIPGVVFINGEKITYYTIDTVNNVLGQIRRGVDGTGTPAVQPIGSSVVDASIQQQIPDSNVGNITLTTSTTYTTTDISSISYGLVLTSNVSVNIGDLITQIDANTSAVTVTMRALQTLANTSVIPVVIESGALQGLPELFDGSAGFDEEGFSDTTSTIYISPYNAPYDETSSWGNAVATSAYVLNSYILGSVNTSGQITVPGGTKLNQDQSWYNTGLGSPATGAGLINSTTPQVEFLLASPGFIPPPEETP